MSAATKSRLAIAYCNARRSVTRSAAGWSASGKLMVVDHQGRSFVTAGRAGGEPATQNTVWRSMMHFGPNFYRTAAICSIVSALTTLGLIFLPYLWLPVEGFDGRMNRINEPAYVLRSWIYLVHPFLVG